MSNDFYIAPAGSGTSGTGTSRKNPIVGLSTVNNNSIGAVAGDRLILLNGTHKERLIIPQNGLTIVSENVLFDGTNSLNGAARLETTPVNFTPSATGSVWQQVSSSPNIWKKGTAVCAFLFLDGEWVEPMPSSNSTNSAATVLANLQELEWSFVYETLDGASRVLYIRLPAGKTPSNYNITCSAGRVFGTTASTGLIEASQKSDLVFEGELNVNGYYNLASHSPSIWLDRCTNVTNKNGQFKVTYSQWGVRVTAGDVSIRAHGEYLLNCAVSIDSADEVSGTKYTSGKIEIYDWYANYCGWMPRYNGTDIQYGDADGGVAVGYKGGTFTEVVIRDGVSKFGGPVVDTLKAGWVGTLLHGGGIAVETADTGEMKKLHVHGNRFENPHARAISVGSSGLIFTDNISVYGNFIKGVRGTDIAVNRQTGILSIRPTKVGSTPITITIANNTISDSTHTISAMALGNSAALTSSIKVYNNIFRNVTLETGYSTNYGMIRVIDAMTTAPIMNNNIIDVADGGVIGRNGAGSAITTYAAWRAAGFDSNGQQGTVVVADDGSVTAGTATPIGTGYKYWTGARPSGFNKEPLPDSAIDIGAFQSTININHPKNLINVTNNNASFSELFDLYPNEINSKIKNIDRIDDRVYGLESRLLDVTFAGSQPDSGYHRISEIVFNSNPSAGGFVGWVCTAAGTPGTWKTFGSISA